LRHALASRLQAGDVTVVEALTVSERKTKAAKVLLTSLGVTGKTLLVDVAFDEDFALAARNIEGVRLVPSGRLTARDVMDTSRIVASRAAIERLQEVLG
jgi:large subunit ribosomal protein L4